MHWSIQGELSRASRYGGEDRRDGCGHEERGGQLGGSGTGMWGAGCGGEAEGVGEMGEGSGGEGER